MQIGLPTIGFKQPSGIAGANKIAPADAESAGAGVVPASRPEAVQRVNQTSASANANPTSDSTDLQAHSEAGGTAPDPAGLELAADEQRMVQQLQARDRQVRGHEQAHLSASGGLANGGPSFSFTTGPDGRRYAVGGEVRIDTSGVPGDPEATIRKAQRIRQAALAPANPSAQDQQVASQASAMEQLARAELAQQRIEQSQEGVGVVSSEQDGVSARTDTPETQAQRATEAAQGQLRQSIEVTEIGMDAGASVDTFV